MILGIGTDICDISRIEKSIDKYGQRFLDKTFTMHEPVSYTHLTLPTIYSV